jgi:hypothetical protein
LSMPSGHWKIDERKGVSSRVLPPWSAWLGVVTLI